MSRRRSRGALSNHERGHIHVHQRDTDDITNKLGSDIDLPDDLATKYIATSKMAMTLNCRRNYGQRIARIIKFWKEHDKDYYAVGVEKVTEEDLHDQSKYYFDGWFKYDIIYSGLNEQFVLHYLVSNKLKENGKFKSVGDLRTIDEKTCESGYMTHDRLKEMLDTFQKNSVDAINKRLNELREELKFLTATETNEECNVELCHNEAVTMEKSTNVFSYGGKFYYVPEDFKFPSASLKEGLRLWLCGQTVSTNGTKSIRPFRQLRTKSLPPHLKNTYKSQWSPIFKYLEEGVTAQQLPSDTSGMTADQIDNYYGHCMDLLRGKVSYCFKKEDSTVWTTGTWSNRISRASVLKFGSEMDKSMLKAPTNRNRANGNVVRKRKRNVLANPKYTVRQERRLLRRSNNSRRRLRRTHNSAETDTTPEDVDDSFATAFASIPTNDIDEEHQNVVTAEIQAEARAQEQNEVANSGLFFHKDKGNVAPNLGDSSFLSRNHYANQLGEALGVGGEKSGNKKRIIKKKRK